MSHYSVLVLQDENSPDIEDMLLPYWEGLEVEPRIYRTVEQLIEKGKQIARNNIEIESDIQSRYIESGETDDRELPEYYKEMLEASYNASTDEDFYNLAVSEGYDYDEEGNELTTYNPNSKWDWYEVGGRWSGLLETIDGKRVNEAKVGDLKIDMNDDDYQDALHFYRCLVEGEEQPEGEDDIRSFYNAEYYKNRYKNAHTYAKCAAGFGTFAVVTPDGVWHEKGQMGWFGCSDETDEEALDWELHFVERFIDPAQRNWTATVVDCHI